MTVKVMLAPSIAQRGPKTRGGSPRSEQPAPRPTLSSERGESGRGDLRGRRPKRRRALVYDAEGNEVFITLVCLKCQKIRPLSQFGLRKMADGAIRNQPWCRSCRAGASAEKPKQGKRQAARPASERLAEEDSGIAASKVVDAGTLAAQVVAALHGGRR
jgi:hypothetical protein